MPDTWDGAAADAMLGAHEYRQLDALLRSWIDGARSHEAVDWVDRRAEEGHVPLVYHAARNLAKGGGGGGGGIGGARSYGGGRVMGGVEFRRAFRLALLLLLRAAQDILSIAVVQGQPPRAATFALLRDKVFGWLGAQFPVSRWPPLSDVLAEVSRCLPRSPPLPAWVLASGPGFATTYLHLGAHLGFDNPSDKAVAACEKTLVPLNEERARVAAAFVAMVDGMSWEGVMGMGVSAFLCGGSPRGAAAVAVAGGGGGAAGNPVAAASSTADSTASPPLELPGPAVGAAAGSNSRHSPSTFVSPASTSPSPEPQQPQQRRNKR